MNTLLDLPRGSVRDEENATAEAQPTPARLSVQALSWSLEAFAQEQIQGLVHHLFLPAGSNPARQVLFTPVDAETQIAGICLRVGAVLSEAASGTICVASVQPGNSNGDHSNAYCEGRVSSRQKRAGVLRDSSQQMSDNLWFMPADVFAGARGDAFSPVYLRARLAEMRLEFDYTILQGPPAATCSEAAVLGGLCDGAVLVLEANSTRRLTAQRVKERLHAANVRLFGTVLTERRFPIPEALYRRV
jgi:hypothetical protein